MTHEWDPDDIFDIWADERARQILVALEREPRPVTDLLEVCEGSRSSLYRRVEVLQEAGLLEERVELDSDGHHSTVYDLAFEQLRVQVSDGGISVDIDAEDGERTERLVPRFESSGDSTTD